MDINKMSLDDLYKLQSKIEKQIKKSVNEQKDDIIRKQQELLDECKRTSVIEKYVGNFVKVKTAHDKEYVCYVDDSFYEVDTRLNVHMGLYIVKMEICDDDTSKDIRLHPLSMMVDNSMTITVCTKEDYQKQAADIIGKIMNPDKD